MLGFSNSPHFSVFHNGIPLLYNKIKTFYLFVHNFFTSIPGFSFACPISYLSLVVVTFVVGLCFFVQSVFYAFPYDSKKSLKVKHLSKIVEDCRRLSKFVEIFLWISLQNLLRLKD